MDEIILISILPALVSTILYASWSLSEVMLPVTVVPKIRFWLVDAWAILVGIKTCNMKINNKNNDVVIFLYSLTTPLVEFMSI